MFLSADNFNSYYGVDLEVARFFVDRTVPKENLYWKNRTIYLPSAPGYIFIPLYFDLLLRSGAEKSELLSETTVQISEFILHSAARHESKQIKWKQHVEEILARLATEVHRSELQKSLEEYLCQERPIGNNKLKLGTIFPSLNRADSYLFLISTLKSERLNHQAALDAWRALMTYFLIMDDLSDIKEDLQNQEENAFVDAGLHAQGVQEISQMLNESIECLNAMNPTLGKRLQQQKNLIDIDAIIQSIRSSS